MSLHPINIYQIGPSSKMFAISIIFSILCRKFSTFLAVSINRLIDRVNWHAFCLSRKSALSVSLSAASSFSLTIFWIDQERASRRIDAIAVARLNLATCIPALSLSLYLFAIETFRLEIVLKQIRILKIRIERRLANISFYSIQRPYKRSRVSKNHRVKPKENRFPSKK